MKNCDALNEFRDGQLWCSTHNLAADHLHDNGDDWICAAAAIFGGCQCCAANRHKGDLSNRQRALEFVFDKLIQAENDVEKVIVSEVKRVLGITDQEG